MSEAASKKPVPVAPVQEPQGSVPRSGSGADTALDAMIKKRKMRVGADPAPPGDPRRKSTKK